MLILFVGSREGFTSSQQYGQTGKLSSAWDSALTAAHFGANNTTSPMTDTGAAAAAAMSKKRAQQRRQPRDDKAPRVLFCLTLENPVRKACIRIVEWTYPFLSSSTVICFDTGLVRP